MMNIETSMHRSTLALGMEKATVVAQHPGEARCGMRAHVVFPFPPRHIAWRSEDNLHNYVGHPTPPLARWDYTLHHFLTLMDL
jgi:hypothetical protein